MHSHAEGTSTTAVTTNALRGPCAMVHRAVCAEAIRVIFALRFLSRDGVDDLAEELQRCHCVDASPRTRATTSFNRLTAPKDEGAEVVPSLVEKQLSPLHRRNDAHAEDGNGPSSLFEKRNDCRLGSAAETFFATSAAARSCIERASPITLCTAAHFLRCNAWTAASLVVGTTSEEDGKDEIPALTPPFPSSAASRTLLRQACAVELLRTREPGWCATALVRFTEWLLRENVSPNVRDDLARALSLTEYERLDSSTHNTAGVPPALLPYGSSHRARWLLSPADADAEASPSQRNLYTEEVVVLDSLPFLFPWLRASRAASSDSLNQEMENGPCDHRWCLEDLPQWCARVALHRQATAWYRHRVLRSAVLRWRTRRGLRVMTYLSRATEHQTDALDDMKGDLSGGTSETHGQEKSHPPTTETSPTASPSAERCAAECQTVETQSESLARQPTAAIPRNEEEKSKQLAQPHQVPGTFAIDTTVTAAAPFAHDEAKQQTDFSSVPAVTPSDPPHAQTKSMNATYEVSLLDRVLQQHNGNAQHTPKKDHRKLSDEDHSNDAAVFHGPNPQFSVSRVEQPPFDNTTPPLSSSASTAPPPYTSATRSAPIGEETNPSNSEEMLPELSERAIHAREVQCIVQAEQCHRITSLRSAFFLWRDRRLYESMAMRYVHGQHSTGVTRQCWRMWKHRCAAASQRRKEARDDALSDMVTERKAVVYFRRLLQAWRRAALARQFQLRTVGSRVVCRWRCEMRLAQYQRAARQPLIGALRTKRELWQRWCDRRMDVVADQRRGHYLLKRTLAAMQRRCKQLQALRVAAALYNGALMAQVWRAWTTRRSRASELCSFAHSVKSEEKLRQRLWACWRRRTLQRERSRRYEEEVRRLYSRQTLQRCFHTWVSRYQLEARVRGFVGRHRRSLLLKPSFETWRVRAEVRGVVRHGQEELAWRVGEQLKRRKVLRVWRRRAVAHAAARMAARAMEIDDAAHHLARLSRLARTFYHWRTRGFLLRRYLVDRRRCFPDTERARRSRPYATAVPPLLVAAIGENVSSGVRGVAQVKEKKVEEMELSPTTTPLPPPPPPPSSSRSAASSAASRNPSARVSPRAARRMAAAAAASPKASRHSSRRSPPRRRVTPATVDADADSHSSGAAAHGHVRPKKEDSVSVVSPQTAAPHSVLAGRSPAVVVVTPETATLRGRRTLALERKLLAAQRHLSLSGFGVCFPATSVERLPASSATVRSLSGSVSAATAFHPRKPSPSTPSVYLHSVVRSATDGASGKPRYRSSSTLSPPPNTSPIVNSSDAVSDVDGELPIRSHTATPLFSRKTTRSSSSTAPLRTLYSASDLVESPPQHPPRQLNATREGDEPHLESEQRSRFVPHTSANRLLSQMELLLKRVRGIEAEYRSPPTAQRGTVQR
ncbi:hypothetical protein ABB37_03324 [Leptomonas pyrrhocoris]|uniref:Sfi1 spindle body domain-containing protein n=1 Tax=Leptomonas pyrrhocoris TaxID=157538 RepID=A0A0N0DWZ1_LEPPY|nr:hypothetical protein ABB37_03324 [Leptomonas pyrrhocoris]KPA82202.1 hypothetical protein ABB37_03324 [Leptomonas pyrrhocoris]|eukprot:XP_015660641.1 hypothetical protein ABB37_03324 [Leptomonas pyrrhocoris]